MQSTYVEPHTRLDRIDGLRALAVAGVLLIHAQMLTPTPLLAPLGHYGQLGVQLFFFLSGYIINMAWDRGGTGTAGFYWNRVARIAPLYYLMLVLSYIFQWSMSPDELNTENFIWHLFFAQGFSGGYAYAGISPMWSLTSEIAFYLVFPFLRSLSTRTLLILFAGSLFFGDVDTGLAYWLTGSTYFSFTPLGALKFMLAGMIVYRHRDLFATPRMVLLSGLFALAMLLLMAGRLLEIEFEVAGGRAEEPRPAVRLPVPDVLAGLRAPHRARECGRSPPRSHELLDLSVAAADHPGTAGARLDRGYPDADGDRRRGVDGQLSGRGASVPDLVPCGPDKARDGASQARAEGRRPAGRVKAAASRFH